MDTNTKYIVIEIQTNAGGSVGTLVYPQDTRNQAESVYHSVLASAAISNVPKHAAVLMTNEGFPLEYKSYTHEVETPTDVAEDAAE